MTRALGIDIGSISIKVAEIDFTAKSQEIVGLYELMRSNDSTDAQLIQNFLQSTSVSTTRIAIGVGNTTSIIRKMQFPFSDSKKVRLAVHSELEDQFPVSLDDFIVDIRPLRKIGAMHEYLIGIVPKSQIEKINALVSEVGIQPTVILDDTQALIELALGQKLPACETDEPYAVCDVGLKHSRIGILKGRNISTLYKEKGIDPFPPETLELRRIERGSLEWIQYISDKRKVSLEEAKSWLIHRAEIQTSKNDLKSIKQDLSDDVKSALRPWVVELYQTFQAARVEHGIVPKTLYLTGGMVEIAGLKDFLAHELRVGVSNWPVAIGFGTEKYTPSESDNRGFASALALTTYFCKKDKKSWLNFKRSTDPTRKILTETLATFAKPENRRSSLHLAGLMLGLMIYGMISQKLLGPQVESSKFALLAELQKVDARTAQKMKQEKIIDSASGTAEEINRIIESKNRKSMAGPPPTGRAISEVLLDLTKTMPKNSVLSSLSYSDSGSQSHVNVALSKVTDKTEADRVAKSLQVKGYSKVESQLAGETLNVAASWTSRKPKGAKKSK